MRLSVALAFLAGIGVAWWLGVVTSPDWPVAIGVLVTTVNTAWSLHMLHASRHNRATAQAAASRATLSAQDAGYCLDQTRMAAADLAPPF